LPERVLGHYSPQTRAGQLPSPIKNIVAMRKTMRHAEIETTPASIQTGTEVSLNISPVACQLVLFLRMRRHQ
ncbi:MAG: hypothetical protein AAF986_01240, partial [Pseudomonadota bacterium]